MCSSDLDAYQDRLARALAMIVNILDPDVIVLGGGVSNIAHLYDGLEEKVATHAFTDVLDTKIRRNVHEIAPKAAFKLGFQLAFFFQ